MIGLCVATAVALGAIGARADEASLAERVKTLEARLAELEGKAVTKADVTSKTLAFIGQTEVGGGVMASYMFDTSDPGSPGTGIPTQGIGTYKHNAFSANLAELYLANPVTASGEKWDGGFRVSLLLGEDVPGLFDGLALGDNGAVWEAYVAMNVPVFNGVVLKVGKFATYLGNEVVEPWANRMVTYGYQFALVEAFTHLGVAAETAINDKLSLMLSVNNGWDQTKDLGDGVSFLGKLAYAPCDKTAISLVGFVGPESRDAGVTSEASETRAGLELLWTQKLGSKLTSTVQLDWGTQNVDDNGNVDWFAAGGWLAYDLTDKWSVTVRGEYLEGCDGLPGLGFAVTPGEEGTKLLSGAACLAFKPGVPGLETRLEVRYDNANDEALFGDNNSRTTIAVAVLYAF
jgi:hypothetical protein